MKVKTSVLIATATRWEASALSDALGLPSPMDGHCEGSVSGHPIVLAKTGVGAVKTAAVLGRKYAANDYGLALSAGLCGALQEGLKTADIVADAHEVEIDYVAPLRQTASALGCPFHFGRILHTNIVLKPDLKRQLGAQQRALACDMETAAVRRWAAAKIPVIGLRCVLDEIQDEIPTDIPEDENASSLLRYALGHWSQAPLLLRTGLRSKQAMKSLSRFLRTYLEAI